MELNEKYFDSLNQPELKELYMELWLAKKMDEAQKVYDYLVENFPYILMEGF